MFIYALVSKCLPRILSVQIGVSAHLCIWKTLTGSTGCVNKGGGFLSVFGGSYFWSFISRVYSGLGEAFWTPRSPVFLSRLAFTPIMEGSFPRGEDLLALLQRLHSWQPTGVHVIFKLMRLHHLGFPSFQRPRNRSRCASFKDAGNWRHTALLKICQLANACHCDASAHGLSCVNKSLLFLCYFSYGE